MSFFTILFDFDGTLVNSADLSFHIYNHLAPRFFLKKVTSHELGDLKNKSSQELMQYLEISPVKLPFLLLAARHQFSLGMNKLESIEGIKNILKNLKNNSYSLGIVTSNSKKNVEKFLTHHDMKMFDFLYSGIQIFGKAYLLEKVIFKKKLNRSQTVYIGDETRDIEAAKKVKIQTIGVTWGFHSRTILEKFSPDYIIDHPEELFPILEKIKNKK